ncbi:MAG: alpha/beta fold hydrolase [bacterium]|nr:alpha/beta fold hydrolase [bacterium]
MPIIERSTYIPPLFFSNCHIQTAYPTLIRKLNENYYLRERIDTPDGDFLDLDWAVNGSKRLAIILHGLEGNTYRQYVLGMVKHLREKDFDSLAWNYRGCSGEMNRLLRFYHNGDTDDLEFVINHALKTNRYKEIFLIGFSMGGNLTLSYLGKKGEDVPDILKKSVTFSVPCDLEESSDALDKFSNRPYLRRFLKKLHEKIVMKMEIMPGKIDDNGYSSIKSFRDFDNRYTAPMNGFKDAQDYWNKTSCRRYLSGIRIPSLIVSSKDDPILQGACYPIQESAESKYVYLEMPEHGGHTGFVEFNKENVYWSEKRAVQFINGEI